MEIRDLLSPETVVYTIRATSKKQVLQELASLAANASGQHQRAIFDVLASDPKTSTQWQPYFAIQMRNGKSCRG